MFAVLLPLNSTGPSKVPPLAFSVPFTVTAAVGKCDARLHRRRAVDGRTSIAAAGKGHVCVFSDRHILGGVRSALQRQRAGQRYGGAVSVISRSRVSVGSVQPSLLQPFKVWMAST